MTTDQRDLDRPAGAPVPEQGGAAVGRGRHAAPGRLCVTASLRPRRGAVHLRPRRVGALAAGLVVACALVTGSLAGAGAGDPAYAATTTVQPGDTLSAIAARYHTTVAALAAANGIQDPNRIFAGATLQIPVTAPPTAPASGSAAPAAPTSPAPAASVVVRPGDTLTSIAAQYHTTVAALMSTNHIANANLVYAGARLQLPAPALPPGWGPGGPLPTALLAHPDRVALRPAFLSAAGASGVPAGLLEAMCWWESGWQSSAVSSTGAIGLCQLEPSTVDYARTKLLHNPTLDPRVAADNIAMAAAYLHDLIVRAGGDDHVALAGYYQGLFSVQKTGMLPSTKTYVAGILNYAAVFAAAG
ncbi:MAG TPA: LysM peptidoglycan-binding domain-containing protein [Acidimicrobiales bacterium]|nr:LysM peptidoglycan-binding domain-containing protein [Acidimicrobiales bacterium]